MTNTLSFNTLFDDLLYTPSRLKFDDAYNYTHKSGLYESKVNEDGLLEITINAIGHDKKDIILDVTDTHIKVKSAKPENSSLFVKDLDLSFKVNEEFDVMVKRLPIHKRLHNISNRLKTGYKRYKNS